MNNNYYARVNLPDPQSLIKDIDYLINFESELSVKIFNSDVLTDVAFEFFKKINVDPIHVIVFENQRVKNVGPIETRFIHSDVTAIKNNQWQPFYCGINWELTPNTESEFSWWDMSNLSAVYPEDAMLSHPALRILNGVHYHERNFKGAHKDAVCLFKTKISGPTLVRTDVPHAVTFCSPNDVRRSISIRFNETWKSWKECLDILSPIISK